MEENQESVLKTVPNESAFPLTFSEDRLATGFVEPGLTKREWFAAMALQGTIAATPGDHGYEFSDMAEDAVAYADELIKALNK